VTLKLYPVHGSIKFYVINDINEKLGTIQEFLLDLETGRVMYAILACENLISSRKFLAVPWELLDFSTLDGHFTLNVPRAIIEKEKGCSTRDRVLETLDTSWLGEIYECYFREPKWEEARAAERQEELFRIQTKREEITRRSLTYYWWRFCRKQRMTDNLVRPPIMPIPPTTRDFSTKPHSN
jgi:hypothetical protein